ncbi:hypothetical protein Bca52824_052343 [Brassica carinata]|uniref:Zinc knuckle CX2CX4HX4C domain-containing protein n=1 Tax=Brassica carinata TaxID=52824 RepID=A0A8X7R1W9_BRACI|nr:hypothetical protein Bca52824_052343 [Brassica carinata]
MVLNKRPCHFNHWIFALERWEPSTSDNFPNTVPFWVKVTGVPVHYWNDQTFDEIAKALGKRLTLDATNARLQVSIDAEKPLQFERRVGFPNGDIGKVSLEYEGLSRHCFGCRRITHDIYSCPELSTEEREQKIKEFRELNQNDTLPLQFNNRATLSIRSNNTSNKRPRSSSDDELRRSSGRTQYPGNSRDEKRRKDIGSYWSSRNHGDDREDRTHTDRRRDDKLARLPVRNATVWNRLENRQEDILREVSASQNRRYDRPRELSKYRSNDRYQAPYSRHSQQVWRPRSQANDSRSNNQTRSIAVSGNRAQDVREVTDTQRTISEVFPRRGTREIQGNGVMVVHRDETPEERMRRLKGKAPMFDEALENTPISAEKRLPAGLLTRDRGIIRIRDEENPVQTEETRYGREEFQRVQDNTVSTQDHVRGASKSVTAKDVLMTGAQSPEGKEPSKHNSLGRTVIKKRQPYSPLVKGARASKKLNLPRGRPSSKLPKVQGISKKTQTHEVPRTEAFLSTKRMNSSATSGSVVSQNHPVRRYEHHLLELSRGRSLLDQEASLGTSSFFCTFFSFFYLKQKTIVLFCKSFKFLLVIINCSPWNRKAKAMD